MTVTALLLSAWLFGGMAAFSAGFAPLLLRLVPMERARPMLRGAFPLYYGAVAGLAALCAVAAAVVDPLAAGTLLLVAATTLWARQDLMHRINAATDRDDATAFARLHGLSVALQLVQIAATGWVVLRLA